VCFFLPENVTLGEVKIHVVT